MRPGLDLEHPLAPLLRAAPEAAPALPGADGPRPLLPWEDESLGLSASLARTLGGVLFRPFRFFRAHRSGRSAAGPFVFGLACGSSGLMLALFIDHLSPAPGDYSWIQSGGAEASAGAAVSILAAPLAVLAWMGFQILWSHLWLLLFGAASGGLRATTRALGYSMAPALFVWVPLLGPAIASVWGLAILIAGLSGLHRGSPLRIAAALFIPPLAAAFLLALGIGGMG